MRKPWSGLVQGSDNDLGERIRIANSEELAIFAFIEDAVPFGVWTAPSVAPRKEA